MMTKTRTRGRQSCLTGVPRSQPSELSLCIRPCFLIFLQTVGTRLHAHAKWLGVSEENGTGCWRC